MSIKINDHESDMMFLSDSLYKDRDGGILHLDTVRENRSWQVLPVGCTADKKNT
jgi:hypothetical protein